MNGLEGSVVSALAESGIARGSIMLVALSGGPDSTALVRALAARRESLALSLAACIVDHGIRDGHEVEADISFVRHLCAALAIPLEVARIPRGDCRARARQAGRGLEEVAREARHRLLREAAARVHASTIALGHTEDDVVETLLMRLLQGCGVEGLRGIPFRRGPFVRPLLQCTRAQVIDYLSSHEQTWREDLTNRDTSIPRNKVRHLLVPVLRESFPGYRAGLLTLQQRMIPVSDHLRSEAARLPWRTSGNGFAITRAGFFSASPAVRACSLLQLYDSFRSPPSPRRLPWRFLSPALREDRGRDGWIMKGHGAGLLACGEELFWGPSLARRGKKGYFIEVYEAGNFAIRATGVRVCLTRNTGKAGVERDSLSLLARDVVPPIVLRSKRKGDEIFLDGGTTSLKELFAGWKVPGPDRERIPLLADRKGVLAVLGGALGYRSRARAGALGGELEKADRIEVRISLQGRGT